MFFFENSTSRIVGRFGDVCERNDRTADRLSVIALLTINRDDRNIAFDDGYFDNVALNTTVSKSIDDIAFNVSNTVDNDSAHR